MKSSPEQKSPAAGDHARIVRDIRWLKAYAAVATLVIAVIGLTAAKSPVSDADEAGRVTFSAPGEVDAGTGKKG